MRLRGGALNFCYLKYPKSLRANLRGNMAFLVVLVQMDLEDHSWWGSIQKPWL
jgi:hypothetical protein